MYQTTKQANVHQAKKRRSPSLASQVLNISLAFIVAVGAAPVLVVGKISELY